jgi:hypothetical protein
MATAAPSCRPFLFLLFSAILLILPASSARGDDPSLMLIGAAYGKEGGPSTDLTPEELQTMSDGNPETGKLVTSSPGDVFPGQTHGIWFRFDFQVDPSTPIDSIEVTWTGRYYWHGPGILGEAASVYFAVAEGVLRAWLPFDERSVSDVRTGRLIITGEDLAASIEDGVASVWVGTMFGTTDDVTFHWVVLQSLDVNARASRAPEAEPVVGTVTPVLLFETGIQAVQSFRNGNLAGGADVDGDGVPDLLLGDAPANSGRVSLISGAKAAVIDEVVAGERSLLGVAVEFVGDLDGDDVSDFVASAAGETESIVFSGATRERLFELLDFPWGGTVVALGDADGDQVPDFLVTPRTRAAPDDLLGIAYSGRTGGALYSAAASSRAGAPVIGGDALGDVDGDTVSDVILSAPEGGDGSGVVWIVSGRNGAVLREHTSEGAIGFARWVHGLGDVTGDGVPDYAVDRLFRSGADGTVVYSSEGHAVGLGQLDGEGGNDVAILADGNLRLLDLAAAKTLGAFSGQPLPELSELGAFEPAGDLDGDGTTDLLIAFPNLQDGTDVLAFRNLRGAPHAAAIDLLPRECPNGLAAQGNAPVEVAVLGDGSADLGAIDVATVRLGGIAPLSVEPRTRDVSAAAISGGDCACPAGRDDGIVDLVLRFDRSDLRGALAPLLEGDVRRVPFSARSSDDLAWFGSDCARLSGHGRNALASVEADGRLRCVGSNVVAPGEPVVLAYSAPASGGACRIGVFDLAGRRVAELVDGATANGTRTTTWDGRDSRGSTVGRGIYFVQARSPGEPGRNALIVVR